MIGVDMELVSRFSKLGRRKDKHFLQRVFSVRELKYCYSKKNPAPHLAARFAGKEAVIKALGGLGRSAPPHRQIEILNDKNGAAVVSLRHHSVDISLAHCDDKALAVVIIKT